MMEKRIYVFVLGFDQFGAFFYDSYKTMEGTSALNPEEVASLSDSYKIMKETSVNPEDGVSLSDSHKIMNNRSALNPDEVENAF